MKNRFDELRRVSWSMPDGKQKLAVMEEMIRIADLYMTEEDSYNVRMDYTSAAMDAGFSEKMLISFAWCVAKFDKNPGRYPHFHLLWHYKWILNGIWRMPEMTFEQIERMFEDFKERCIRHGHNLRAYHQKRVNLFISLGMFQEAAESYKLWRSTPRDSLADCQACEQNLFGEFSFKMNHLKRGMQAVKPILEGRMVCGSVPQNTYSLIIIPLMKLKEYDRAVAIAKKAVRELEGPQYLEEYGVFLEFFTITDMTRATKLYEQTIRYGLESKIGWSRLQYFYAVRLFLNEWGKTKRRKRLAESDRVTLPWIDHEIAKLTEAFNRRNGSLYVNEFLTEKQKHTERLVAAYRNSTSQ
ncbi:hypothetical protein ACWGPW_08385 [Paenibacillus chitinolyticus]